MPTKTEICNLALYNLGAGKTIANVDSENSQEAYACKVFFDIAKDKMLRDFCWPFAKKIAPLGLVEELTDNQWAYSYAYPSDCLKIRKILSGIRNDTRQSRVPYIIVNGASGQLIYTDQDDAELEYIKRITNYSVFPPDFSIAFSFLLASYIAPRIAKGNVFKYRDGLMKAYLMELESARANAGNEEQEEEAPDSEFERSRV